MAEVDPLGDSGEESVQASLDPPLFVFVELTGLLAYRVPYNRPARTMPVDGEAGAALACRCPVRGTSGPRCIRAGRDYPAGLPSYQEPM